MSGTAVTTSGLKSKNNYTLRLAEILGWSGSGEEKNALDFLRQQPAKELITAQARLVTKEVGFTLTNKNSSRNLHSIFRRNVNN